MTTAPSETATAAGTDPASIPAQTTEEVMALAHMPMGVAAQLTALAQERHSAVTPAIDASTSGLLKTGGDVMVAADSPVAEALDADVAHLGVSPTDLTVALTTSSLAPTIASPVAALPGGGLSVAVPEPAAVAVPATVGQASLATTSLATMSVATMSGGPADGSLLHRADLGSDGEAGAFDPGVDAARSTTRGLLTPGATQSMQAQAEAAGIPSPATPPAFAAATRATVAGVGATAGAGPASAAHASATNPAAIGTAVIDTALIDTAVIGSEATAHGQPLAGTAATAVTSALSASDSAASGQITTPHSTPSQGVPTHTLPTHSTLTRGVPTHTALDGAAAVPGGRNEPSLDDGPVAGGAVVEQPRPADQMPVDRTTAAAQPSTSPLSPAAPTTAATVAATHAAPAQAAAAPPPVHSQVVAALTPVLHRRDGSYSVELQLDPASLGRVRVSVTITGGEISVQMMAADPSARDLLRDNSDQLRHQLTQSGFDATSVDVGDDSRGTWQDPRGEQPTTYRSDRSIAGQPDATAAADAHPGHRPATGGNGPLDLQL